MAEYAADVEHLLASLEIDRAAVVGLSMGGLVAMELATSYPRRYWALGLVTTTVKPVSDDERAERLARAAKVEHEGMQGLIDYVHTGLYGPRCPVFARTEVDAMMTAVSAGAAATALRGRAERPDYRPRLQRLELPTLVCAGSNDPWSDEAVTAEIARNLKRPEVMVIDGVGHLPNLEAPILFNKALSDFLSRHAPVT